MSRSSEQSEEEILPLPLRYTQSQGQNDKGKLGGRMTRGEGLAMTIKKVAMAPPLSLRGALATTQSHALSIRVKSFKYLTQQGIVESYNF